MQTATDKPVWERDGRDWPNREASRFVTAGGLRWHVQVMGSGPVALLAHGTGASTHSWRALAPLLAGQVTVVAPDLPGHAFTDTPPANRLSLGGMAAALGALLHKLQLQPALAVGHSAGAAVLARMSLDKLIDPRALVSLNGALLPLRGMPGHLFAPLARVLAGNAVMPRLLAWRARDRTAVARLIASTGSTIEPAGVELYARLLRSPAHVAGVLSMMANWDLRDLERQLPQLEPALTLVVGGNDRTVPPAEAQRVRVLLPGAQVRALPGLGHLAHEERPRAVAEVVAEAARSAGVLPPG